MAGLHKFDVIFGQYFDLRRILLRQTYESFTHGYCNEIILKRNKFIKIQQFPNMSSGNAATRYSFIHIYIYISICLRVYET